MQHEDQMSNVSYTQEELEEFNRLTWTQSSLNNLERIIGRLEMSKFVKEHSKEKCDAMWEEIKKREADKD
ncbi:hypothetical protein AU106_gp183 [Sinorhizobium phage phiM9]|uniref:Uncharacterized protein n=1 Tax=Sinorhizobium phage phiM9 TaxID=1636182 RepID=A0A0F6TGU3_9CAUD|nr:hypothetical protein AU106_gp183 [Sinorhizobium phage phiM9]AKE44814.1 hypothetical protein Sm_phiM9_187 [Sinorhizobium phage phiM9]